MSSKSSRKSSQNRSPYKANSKRGRGTVFLVSVVVIAMAAGTWITSYTRGLRNGTTHPNGGQVQAHTPGAVPAAAAPIKASK